MDFKSGGSVASDLQIFYQFRASGASGWTDAVQVSGVAGASINDSIRGGNIARPVVAANGAFVTWNNTTKAAMWWATANSGAGSAFTDNVDDAVNLFDSNDASLASVAAGVVGNVYYHASELAPDSEDDVLPIERVTMKWVVPAGGLIRVYASQAETENTLTGASGITDWALVATIDETWLNTRAQTIHMARRARWVRLEIQGGTSVKTDVGAFECQSMMNRIEDGDFPPNPTAGFKQRFWFDQDSHRQASQITGELESELVAGLTSVFFTDNTPDEFFDQFQVNDEVVLMKGTRGTADRLAMSNVFSINKPEKKIEIIFPVDITFSAGARLMPAPKWFQIRAKDAADALIGLSNWIPTIGVEQPNIRSTTTYGSDN